MLQIYETIQAISLFTARINSKIIRILLCYVYTKGEGIIKERTFSFSAKD